jgi:hypothetical protein
VNTLTSNLNSPIRESRAGIYNNSKASLHEGSIQLKAANGALQKKVGSNALESQLEAKDIFIKTRERRYG